MNVTETLRVTVRTAKTVLATDLTIDDAVKFLDTDSTPNREVFWGEENHLPVDSFRMWVRSVKAAEARNAARAAK